MSDTDDQTDIEIEGQVEGVEQEAPPEKDELAELRAQLDAEKRRADAAESETANYRSQHSDSQSRLKSEIDGRLGAEDRATEAALAVAQTALKTAKAEFVKANEEGRFADAAEVAEQIADAKLALNSANYRKQQLADVRSKLEAEAESRASQGSASPEENFLQTIAPASAAWLRRNPDVLSKMVSDQRYFAKIAALDNEAYAEGNDRDTPAYFAYIEAKLGLNADDAPAPTKRSRSAGNTAAAAPSTRRSSGATAAGRTVHLDDVVSRLTPQMREAALSSYPRMPEAEALATYTRGLIVSKQRDPSFMPEFKI